MNPSAFYMRGDSSSANHNLTFSVGRNQSSPTDRKIRRRNYNTPRQQSAPTGTTTINTTSTRNHGPYLTTSTSSTTTSSATSDNLQTPSYFEQSLISCINSLSDLRFSSLRDDSSSATGVIRSGSSSSSSSSSSRSSRVKRSLEYTYANHSPIVSLHRKIFKASSTSRRYRGTSGEQESKSNSS